MDFDTLKDVLAALEHHGVRYVIFRATALNVHGLARFTEDLDIFIAPDRENVEHLKDALRSVLDDPHIDEISSDDLQGPYPAIQVRAAGRGVPHRHPGPARRRVSIRGSGGRATPVRVHYGFGRHSSYAIPDEADTVHLKDRADAAWLRERFGLDDD